MTATIRLGILRLVDSAPALVAATRGLFASRGLDVQLSIEPSWANIADKLAYGLLDAAIMLPPLALAATLGLRGPRSRIIVPMGISLGGNTIAMSHAAAEVVLSHGSAADSASLAVRFARWVATRPERPRLAVVHVFSAHNLLLRQWLSSGGLDPDHDVDIVSVPPEQVVDALAEGRIDTFCAGAPWGDIAERQGVGRAVLGTSAIWPHHPEKCLALAAGWAEGHPEAVERLLRAMLEAARLCDAPEQSAPIAALLASEDGLGLPERASFDALPGGVGIERIRFFGPGASIPDPAHATLFLREMRRWGWIDAEADLDRVVADTYRPAMVRHLVARECGDR
jgi:two-component system, oxyanion-binding sensor